MPTNLNALLRYKTIDQCLSNSFLECTIEILISKCNEALTEQQTSETSISERSIRNDIRIMRSDALGFNAPIIVKNGVYSYETPGFSIFSRPVKEVELLEDLQNLLVAEFGNIQNKNLPYLLHGLQQLTGNKIPRECMPEDYFKLESKVYGAAEIAINRFKSALESYIWKETLKSYRRKKKFFSFKKFFWAKNKYEQELPEWRFIFDAIG